MRRASRSTSPSPPPSQRSRQRLSPQRPRSARSQRDVTSREASELLPQNSAKEAGLRYVSDSTPGITRHRRGKGFLYIGPDGKVIRQRATLERIRHLAIPPAWKDVWIALSASAHLQATGRDARGRKQYRY